LPVLALHVLVLGAWPAVGPGGRPSAQAGSGAVATVRLMATRPAPAAIAAPGVRTTPSALPRTSPPAPQAEAAAPPSPFLPARVLDRRPAPVSAPDPRWLDELAHQPGSGLPLRLRLFITAAGEVVGVEPVEVSALDAVALPALQAMFRDTAFLPGRVQGRDVASQIELELHLDGIAP
jgi:hypothetical protein